MLNLWQRLKFKPMETFIRALPEKVDTSIVHPYSVGALPAAPRNPYRKRPTKIAYQKNDYLRFRLPSEEAFLLRRTLLY